MNTHDIELPEPAGHFYEWDGGCGTRKFTAAPHNGRECDRAVAYYTEDQMVAALQSQDRDGERLMFACGEFDRYTTVSKDRYEYAIECAQEAGREVPTKEDELNGLRRLIDAAIDHARRTEGGGE